MGIDCDREIAEKAYLNSELWIGGQLLKELNGAPRMPDDEFEINISVSLFEMLYADKPRDELEALACKYNEVESAEQEWVLMDGVLPVLQKLTQLEYRLGVVSNFDSSLRDILKDKGIEKYFGHIVVSAEEKVYKPDPEILEIACARFDTMPVRCLYIGDHPFDILCAKEAEMDILLINRFYESENLLWQPTYMAKSIKSFL